MSATPKAPFPAFGGKSRVASLVWERIGDVDNAIEPFCNSAAWLLARPHPPRIETLNDIDCMVANFWRATSKDPETVAEHADGPVNEADLHARHRWLVLSDAAAEFRQRMRTDPDYFDARVAGWWCWGACCWIGSGWCADAELRGDGLPREKVPFLGQGSHAGQEQGRGVHARGEATWDARPYLGCQEGQHGIGVHARGLGQQVPRLSVPVGQGVNSEFPDSNRPQLADAYARGRGVHGNDDAGTCAQWRAWLVDWFGRLRDRLRTVRVCCGDWKRVCGSPSVTTRLGVTGIFLDPPYPSHAADGSESRAGGLYATDGGRDDLDRLRDEVLEYCRERGSDPRTRLAVCGYDTDGYAALESLGWERVEWKASGGYGNRSEVGKANAGRERIWFSPACLAAERDRMPLFDVVRSDLPERLP